MCRVYQNKRAGDYVRLCYRSGTPGRKVAVDGWTGEGCHPAARGAKGAPRKRERVVYSLTFQVSQRAQHNPVVRGEEIAEMARHADAIPTILEDGRVILSRSDGWHNAQGLIARAASFGWKLDERSES